MQQPTRLISTPFAQEGEKTEIQNVTGEFDNSATYRLGFPPLTMQSIRLGGKPPKGTDFNGVLFDITENISFLCKGGRYQYNAGLSTLIGGYPEGSNLLLDDNVTEVVSTVAGNQNNPNTDMTGWILKPNKTTAVNVADASGETQQQVNYNGGSKWHSRVGGYLENERVVLANGDIVKSTVDGNTNDPNVDMAGWVNTSNHNSLTDRDAISSHPSSAISLNQNGSVQNSLHNRLHIAQFGGVCDGISDDSDALQAVINDAQDLANSLMDIYNGMRTPVSIVISGSVLIKKTINIRGDLVRICGENGASIIVDKNGVYTNNYAFNISGTSSFASYSAHTGALFKDILFKSVDKIVDLFYTGESSATGGNGGVELKNIVRCSFFGFRRIFSNGVSGWGWNWLQCQACLCDTWLYCSAAADTGERQTFTGCIWQNGGYAFTFAGGATPIYWTGGSFDYCGGIINETVAVGANLTIFLNSHFEWRANNYNPCIVLLSAGINVVMSGNMAVSATNTYYLFSQVRHNQIKFNDLMFTGGDGFESLIFLDPNYTVDTRNAKFPSDVTGRVRAITKLAQQEILDLTNAKTFATVVLSNTAQHTATLTNNGWSFASTGGSGASGNATIDIPISGLSTLLATVRAIPDTVAAVGLTYSVLDQAKTVKYTFSDYSTNSVAPSTSETLIRTGILTNLPAGAAYLRITLNLFGVSLAKPFLIKSIRIFSQ